MEPEKGNGRVTRSGNWICHNGEKRADKGKDRKRMKACSMTDIGVEREMNQDYLFTSDSPVGNLPNLYIVADGMGGHKAGEYASRYTTERVVAYVLRSKDSEPVTILKEAIQKANELLLIESKEDEAKHGMGTTIVCATVIGNKMFVANVGDSRLYVVSDKIRQITRDHSLVEEMVRMGEMDRREARKHPDKNIITRAVGVAETVDVDFFEVDLAGEDEILMCTDGLTNMVDDMTIFELMKKTQTIEEQVAALIQTANDNGGRDNITAIVIRPINDEVKAC
jgi:protein phosphatase